MPASPAFALNYETRLVTDWLNGPGAGVARQFPLALILGPLRAIPAFWTPVDCSFGVLGLIPLLLAYRHIRVLERESGATTGIAQPGLAADHAGPARA